MKSVDFRNDPMFLRNQFARDGTFEMPVIKKTKLDLDDIEFIGYDKLNEGQTDKIVHFFLDDYQFNRVWTDPDKYISMLQRFKYVLTPDFSLYTDFPKPLQIYNHYRKHWLGAYWQMHGINVIPTICWSDRDSFEWCFDGEPTQSVVAVSSVGTQNSAEKKRRFLDGYFEMVERLEPELIIFYGRVPEECKEKIVKVNYFDGKWSKA